MDNGQILDQHQKQSKFCLPLHCSQQLPKIKREELHDDRALTRVVFLMSFWEHWVTELTSDHIFFKGGRGGGAKKIDFFEHQTEKFDLRGEHVPFYPSFCPGNMKNHSHTIFVYLVMFSAIIPPIKLLTSGKKRKQRVQSLFESLCFKFCTRFCRKLFFWRSPCRKNILQSGLRTYVCE